MIEDIDTRKYNNYDTANGWKNVPSQILECKNQGHRLYERKIGHCLHEVRCDICRWRYEYDSSG